MRDYYHTRLTTDPEFRAALRQQSSRGYAARKKKMQENPQLHAEFLAKVRERFHSNHEFAERIRANKRKLYRDKCARAVPRDPNVTAKRQAQSKAWHATVSNDEAIWHKRRLYQWVYNNTWVRDDLEWETHQPVLYPAKVEQVCADCNRLRPLKLWWRRKNDPLKYDCYPCFFEKAGPEAVPKGLEGFVFKKGVRFSWAERRRKLSESKRDDKDNPE